MHMLCLIMYKVRYENGYGFLRPRLKTGMGKSIFWSDIGSGFGDASGTPPPKIPRSTPHPREVHSDVFCRYIYFKTEVSPKALLWMLGSVCCAVISAEVACVAVIFFRFPGTEIEY